MDGVGALTSAAGGNIGVLKKAIEAEESLIGRLLEGASAQALESSATQVANGGREVAAEATQRGVNLDLSA